MMIWTAKRRGSNQLWHMLMFSALVHSSVLGVEAM